MIHPLSVGCDSDVLPNSTPWKRGERRSFYAGETWLILLQLGDRGQHQWLQLMLIIYTVDTM